MKKLFILAFSFFLPFGLYAGGWIPKKGQGFFQLSEFAILNSEDFYNGSGEVVSIATNNIYTSSLYLEYGLGSNWSFEAYVPFFYRQTASTPSGIDELNAFGDMSLTTRYGLIQDRPFVLSIGLTLGIPSGVVGGGSTGILNSGDGEFNQIITLEAARVFGNFFAQVGIGFNNRTQGFSEEFRYSIYLGYRLERLRFIASLA